MGDGDVSHEGLNGARRQRNGNWAPDWPCLTDVLERATVQEAKLLPSGSNYVFVLALQDDEAGPGAAIYKPERGEAPLWDYPEGSLYRRERAAYLLSEALGWGIVPPTVIRDGPHGVGMAQLHIDHDPRVHFFTFREEREADLRRIALFDVLANNGDRKGGHCLLDGEGHIWGIDHGLTFHQQTKLRTVIWDYAGDRVQRETLEDVQRLSEMLRRGDPPLDEVDDLLGKGERKALRGRVEWVLKHKAYPNPPSYRAVPWPAI